LGLPCPALTELLVTVESMDTDKPKQITVSLTETIDSRDLEEIKDKVTEHFAEMGCEPVDDIWSVEKPDETGETVTIVRRFKLPPREQ
jgi:hypothetical protein